MTTPEQPEILDVTADNVGERGFFCQMSKRGTPGYQRKLDWLNARFSEGLRIKLLRLPARGFIEYIPGEYAWRAVEASGYMLIHCLWVVGQSKGKGYASRLLAECLADSERAGLAGVAMVTSRGNWLTNNKLLLKHGFEQVELAPPAFELMVKRFRAAPPPRFSGDWEAKAGRHGRGFTVLRADQCPYHQTAVDFLRDTAAELKAPFKLIELTSSRQVREQAPYAYGVYNVVYEGRAFAYHYLFKKDILKRLEKLRG